MVKIIFSMRYPLQVMWTAGIMGGRWRLVVSFLPRPP